MKQPQKLLFLSPHSLFLGTILVILFVKDGYGAYNHLPFLILLGVIEVACLLYTCLSKKKTLLDSFCIVYLLLCFWELFALKLTNQKNNLFPPPEQIIDIFAKDYAVILENISVSLTLLGTCCFFALVIAVPLGILTGANQTLREIFLPLAKLLSPVPPIIYVPYAVLFFASFKKASFFIVFLSMFWGMFLRMIYTVSAVPLQLLRSANSLNIGRLDWLTRFWFPYVLPQIFSGVSLTLPGAFMCLIFAETLNGRRGIGFYTRFHAQFGNYDRVLAGILIDAILMIALNLLIKKLKARLVRYP